MPANWAHEGLSLAAQLLADGLADVQVRLYKGGPFGGEPWNLASFTEANFPGYVRKNVSGPTLRLAADGKSVQIVWPAVRFTRSPGPNSTNFVHGYVLATQGLTMLWFDHLFPNHDMSNAGDTVGFRPVMTVFHQACP